MALPAPEYTPDPIQVDPILDGPGDYLYNAAELDPDKAPTHEPAAALRGFMFGYTGEDLQNYLQAPDLESTKAALGRAIHQRETAMEKGLLVSEQFSPPSD